MSLPSKPVIHARNTRTEAAYSYLLEQILEQKLSPGAVLKDDEIAKALGFSRTPVRDAIRRLHRMFLVEVVPNRYTRVAPLENPEMASLVASVSLLYNLALERAVPGASGQQLSTLRSVLRAIDSAVEAKNVRSAVANGFKYMDVVSRIAQSELLQAELDVLSPQVQRATYVVTSSADLVAIRDCFHALHEAVSDENIELAQSVLTRLGGSKMDVFSSWRDRS